MGSSGSKGRVDKHEELTSEDCLAEKTFKVSNLGDAASLKRCVDDAAAIIVVSNGYPEDVHYSNVRIVLGFIACAFALVGQFYPMPFPENWNLLVACVAGYIAASAVLNWHTSTYEGDAILFTHPREGSGAGTALKLTTLMKRYSDEVTIVLAPRDPKASGREEVKETFSVCRWFDVNGEMDKGGIQRDVERLLRKFESGDSEPKKSK